jgi:hypothetical protein
MRAEDYLPMAAELKKSLNLNANQQTLWSQTESRTRKLLAERKARRERLQAAALAGAQGANAELRDLARRWTRKPTSAPPRKAAARMVADCQRRPDRSQRQTVVQLVAEQLQRVQDNGGGPSERRKGRRASRRQGRRGGGGMGGMSGGPGGLNVSLPGG